MAGKPRTRSGKVCGAKNRRGLPCQSKRLLRGGKCRFHGGCSSGPKTPEGRTAIIASNMRRKGEKRPNYTRKPKPQPTPPPDPWIYITELMSQSPGSVSYWRRQILNERGQRPSAIGKAERRALAIEAVQRRRAWLAEIEGGVGDE